MNFQENRTINPMNRRDINPVKEVPSVSKDGWFRLAAAILIRAIKDFLEDDPLISLDALSFLVSDGQFYLDCFNINSDRIYDVISDPRRINDE